MLSREFIRASSIKRSGKYICCMKAGLQELLTYRSQYFIGLLLLLIPFAVKNCIWMLAFGSNEEIAGYTFDTILQYNYLILIFSALLSTNVHWAIANEIKTGDLSKYLAKPISHQGYWFHKGLGNKIGQSVYVLLLFAMMCLICPGVFSKVELDYIAAGTIAFVFAYIMNFLIFYNFSLLSFRFLEISSFFTALELLMSFLNGEYLPIDLMPDVWVQISKFLPVHNGIYFVVQTFMGSYSGREIVLKMGIQIGWIILLALGASYNWKKGIRLYESAGI